MKKLRLSKVIASTLVVASVIALNPIGVSAEWRQDSNGWWNSKGSSWSTGWDNIDSKCYYFGQDGYMKTGWVEVDKRWYYLYSSGEKAVDTVIGGYTLDLDGAWINKPTKEAEEARNLILKEDSKYIAKYGSDYRILKKYRDGISTGLIGTKWKIPEEEVFVYELVDSQGAGGCTYMVGKTSKNIYCLPNQGFVSAYQIKDNEVVKTFEWTGDGAKHIDWRNFQH